MLVVVGDALLDRDVDGHAERLSPEAPVPVIEDLRQRSRPGGAGLAAALAAADGRDVALITALGHDDPGRELARLLDDENQGNIVVGQLRTRLQSVRSRLAGRKPPRVLFIVWGDPLVVPGRSAFLTDALTRAGGASVTSDAPAAWPAFDVESAIARAPDVILATPQNRGVLDRLRRDAAWAKVPAVLAGRLMIVSEAIEQPGPGVVTGIEEVARALHPDAFGASDAERR